MLAVDSAPKVRSPLPVTPAGKAPGPRGDSAVCRTPIQPALSPALAGRGRLHLLYQPRVNLRTLRLESIEALLRWAYPTRGVRGLGASITLAERTGDILPIGAWVIEQAVRQASLWRHQHRPVRIAVNVSPLQIDHGTVLPVLRRSLARHGVPPQAIEIEVTETAGVRDEAAAAAAMRELRALGVPLAIDDFGKGCAGIATLRWLPASVVKLDKEIVDALDGGCAHAQTLARALIAFAHELEASCVAEGVETFTQFETLRRLGCDHAQGYFFSEPVESNELRDDYSYAAKNFAPAGVDPPMEARNG
jgi:EAL domain-containing protein (putative c-di-GMP-specific phosphodiesterase class I)